MPTRSQIGLLGLLALLGWACADAPADGSPAVAFAGSSSGGADATNAKGDTGSGADAGAAADGSLGADAALDGTAGDADASTAADASGRGGSDAIGRGSDAAPLQTCSPGDSHCEGLGARTVCRSDGSGYDTVACAKGEACSKGICLTVQCQPGSGLCGGGGLKTCNATGTGWDGPEPCGPGEQCVSDHCTPPVCKPGTATCSASGAEFVVCAANGYGIQVKKCAPGTACTGGECVAQVCNPGDKSCSAGAVEACNEQGLGWVTVQTCGDSEVCLDGACLPSYCGDNLLGPGEACDDGNAEDGDGCSSKCKSEIVWKQVYEETFDDGKAQGWTTFTGGCGWQGAKTVAGKTVWNMTSDWQGMRRDLPPLADGYRAMEADLRIVNKDGLGYVGFRTKSTSWNQDDQSGFNFYLNPQGSLGFCLGHPCVGAIILPYKIGLWAKVRVEEKPANQTYRAFVNSKLVAQGSSAIVPIDNKSMNFYANGKCGGDRMQISAVRFLGGQ